MRPLEELTLYTYGLLEEHEEAAMKSHVEDCSSCTEQIRRLRSERRVFERATARGAAPEAPADLLSVRVKRPRRALLVAGLAAAALLAVLAWLLSQPLHHRGTDLSAPVTTLSGDDIDRLVTELKSPSALRREIAALALKAYGSGATEKLEKAHADPALVDACRGIAPGDRAILRKLKEIRIAIDMKNAPLTAVVDHIRDASQLNFHITGIDQPDQEIPSVKAKDTAVDEALRLMLEPRGLCHRVRDGVVLITTQAAAKTMDEAGPPAHIPVRFSVDETAVQGSILALAADAAGERDRGSAALLRLGFAAEPALWKALDASSPEVRARASDVLRKLYGPQETGQPADAERTLDETILDLDFQDAKFSEILTFLGDSLRLPIVVVPDRVDINTKMTFRTKQLSAKNDLKLLIAQLALDYLVVDGTILILDPAAPMLRTPRAPIWAAPEEAKRIEAALLKIATEDKVDVLRVCQTGDLGALLLASRTLDGAAAGRCRRAAALVAEEARVWLIDQSSGTDLQKLTGAQMKIMNTECKPAENETLDKLLSRVGLKHSMKARVETPVRVYGAALKVSSLLKAVTRPNGRDFYMEGETLVIDTSANVRAAVEK